MGEVQWREKLVKYKLSPVIIHKENTRGAYFKAPRDQYWKTERARKSRKSSVFELSYLVLEIEFAHEPPSKKLFWAFKHTIPSIWDV